MIEAYLGLSCYWKIVCSSECFTKKKVIFTLAVQTAFLSVTYMHRQWRTFDSPHFICSLTAHFNNLWARSAPLIHSCKFCPSTRISGLFPIRSAELSRRGSVGGRSALQLLCEHRSGWHSTQGGLFFLIIMFHRKTVEPHGSKCSSKCILAEFSLQRRGQLAGQCWRKSIERNLLQVGRAMCWR